MCLEAPIVLGSQWVLYATHVSAGRGGKCVVACIIGAWETRTQQQAPMTRDNDAGLRHWWSSKTSCKQESTPIGPVLNIPLGFYSTDVTAKKPKTPEPQNMLKELAFVPKKN